MAMGLQGDYSLDLDPRDLVIQREIGRSEASTVFEVRICGKIRVMKLFHDNGDPGYSRRGRDLNRFRCELNAYRNLLEFGVCERGFVPFFYGYIDRLDPSPYHHQLNHFKKDKFLPRAIVLEYIPEVERLNCLNYSDDLFRYAVDGIREIHDAHVHHHDIYPKNMLVVSGTRIVWIDFDVATTFQDMGTCEQKYCEYEVELVKSFGKLLKDDQLQGLPPNTKYY
ncbi:uncharacterized protein LDX57_007851 [Aspergillus melleus]|uniref:uncharacterized protein n=1 Tax=Aspergillus melleus TaxID=138277 RepID=UPI001E8EC696|nr:uncharacterized protein LDX57_007851 [Aspergillus melleus]KAH8430181.1 hypothetical protein LDX57_007851 [Aspergillus melleus]